jgi:hypothetical protein
VVLVSSKIALPLQTPHPCGVGSHLRWLQIGLRPWLMEATANLPQQQRQQHWQLWHWLLLWWWQCGSSSSGLHPNGQGSRARPGRGRRCAQALPLWLALQACGSGFALAAWLCTHTTIKQQSSGRKSFFGSAAAYLPQR